jgi:hypothetical protein
VRKTAPVPVVWLPVLLESEGRLAFLKKKRNVDAESTE